MALLANSIATIDRPRHRTPLAPPPFPQRETRAGIDSLARAIQNDAVVAFRALGRDLSVDQIVADPIDGTRERIAISAAAACEHFQDVPLVQHKILLGRNFVHASISPKNSRTEAFPGP